MMKNPDSFILKSAVGIIFFFTNLLALYLLFRGHNMPGGGFIGGLASAMSLILMGLVVGFDQTEKALRVDPLRIAAGGLLLSVITAGAPMVGGYPFFEHFDWHLHVPMIGELHVGTPLFFDIGVLLVVVGVSSKIVFVLSRSVSHGRGVSSEEEVFYSALDEEPVEKEAGILQIEKMPLEDEKEEWQKNGLKKEGLKKGEENAT